MTENDVTQKQAAQISRGLYPVLNYLGRLRNRMEKAGFLPADPFFGLVKVAYNAVHHLNVHVHYMSCTGVFNPPRRSVGASGSLGPWIMWPRCC